MQLFNVFLSSSILPNTSIFRCFRKNSLKKGVFIFFLWFQQFYTLRRNISVGDSQIVVNDIIILTGHSFLTTTHTIFLVHLETTLYHERNTFLMPKVKNLREVSRIANHLAKLASASSLASSKPASDSSFKFTANRNPSRERATEQRERNTTVS